MLALLTSSHRTSGNPERSWQPGCRAVLGADAEQVEPYSATSSTDTSILVIVAALALRSRDAGTGEPLCEPIWTIKDDQLEQPISWH